MRFIRLIIMTALAFWVAAGDPVRAQVDYAAQKVIYHINMAAAEDAPADASLD
jgi:heme/copper-type cytochrome/quinol oxidase subunit 4